MRIRATKMDGCGNSFLVVDEIKTPLAQYDRTKISNALAVQHNTDGILYIDHHLGMPTMKIFDRDGTEETMCGNGYAAPLDIFVTNTSRAMFFRSLPVMELKKSPLIMNLLRLI